jgi:protein-disulfide isomerase
VNRWWRDIDRSTSIGILIMAALLLLLRASGLVLVPPIAEAGYVEAWEQSAAVGMVMGSLPADVVVTHFVDFECAYSGAAAQRIDSLVHELVRHHSRRVTVIAQHFPSAMHRFSIEASIAAECADQQQQLKRMHDVLFVQADSFGIKSWAQLASDAGVSDLSAFESCIRMPVDHFPRIAAGRLLGEKYGVSGTPTIWLNGRVAPRSDLRTIRTLARKVLR